MKRGVSLLLSAALLLGAVSVACAAAPALSAETIGEGKAQIVTVDMAGRSAFVTLGQGSVAKDMSLSEHIARAATQIGSAPALSFNGASFQTEYQAGQPLSYPDNCALIQQTVMSGGRVVIGGGEAEQMTLGFTDDGRALVGRAALLSHVTVGEKTYTPVAVNRYDSDPSAILLFTEELGYSVSLPQESTVLWIVGGMVSMMSRGGSFVVPSGAMALVFNEKAYESAAKENEALKAGAPASLSVEIRAQDAGDQDAWNHVVTAVAGEYALVENGESLADELENAEDRQDASEEKTFAARLKDGKLLVGTASATPAQLAEYLISAGAENALCLDGGASSALYVNGKTVTNAGRRLSNVLHITGEAEPVETDPLEGVSDWAKETVSSAVLAGYVPAALQSAYQDQITRLEFCRMARQFLDVSTDLNALLAGAQISAQEAAGAFTDTLDQSVLLCYRLEIVSGKGEGRFDPNGLITRQEAAKILTRIADLTGRTEETSRSVRFADAAKIAPWAADYVDRCVRLGLLQGKPSGFDPEGHFTREEAIATIWRMHP